MILKDFFGKTIKIAKKSAWQMYENNPGTYNQYPNQQKEDLGNGGGHPKQKNKKSEATGVNIEQSDFQDENHFDTILQTVREYATEQTSSALDEMSDKAATPKQPEIEGANTAPNLTHNASVDSKPNSYSRAHIRSDQFINKAKNKSVNWNNINGKKLDFSLPGNPLLSHFSNPSTKFKNKHNPSAELGNQTNRQTLQKRVNKLESIFYSSLALSDSKYLTHPSFLKLLRSGVSKYVITKWFDAIIKKGIDPYKQQEIFNSKLTGILTNALGSPAKTEPKKFMLFTGLAASGKTQLIMKLSQHPAFLRNKKLAFVSMQPSSNQTSHSYTRLAPFCEDKNFKYYEVKTKDEVIEFAEEWNLFDHILIDTPSLSAKGVKAFNQYKNIKTMLGELTSIEEHYLINASARNLDPHDLSETHFSVNPDHIAITHLDEATKWGALIPLLEKMECVPRYVSMSKTIPGNLYRFDPKKFIDMMLDTST